MIDNNFDYKILVIEDGEQKAIELLAILNTITKIKIELTLATNMVDAERKIKNCTYDLLILDISLNLSKGSTSTIGNALETLGGLKLAQRMHATRKEIPTIVVTAFDAFPSSNKNSVNSSIFGIDEINSKIRNTLGDYYLGTVKYGDENWKMEFSTAIAKAIKI